MADIVFAKSELIKIAEQFEEKRRLAEKVGDDYYEPGMMENLEQYMGSYDESSGMLTLRTDVKGLRYENRSLTLDHVSVGDPLMIVRDKENEYNSNNFTVKNCSGESLGNLPSAICNALAVLYDTGCASIESSTASYVERLRDRSRYAVQGVLFAKLCIKLNGDRYIKCI